MDKKILEIGCGHGFNSYLLSLKSHNNVYGVDLDEENIEICNERYKRKNLFFSLGNSQKLNFEDNFFHEIHAIDVLEHVDNLDQVINECVRVLKLNGKFIINVPFYKSEKWLLKLRPTYFEEIHHVRIFKYTELDSLLSEKGFSLFKKERRGFLQHIELFFLFKRKKSSHKQIGIGNWRDTNFTKFIHVCSALFSPICLKTPLKYFPLWIITIPIGYTIDLIGNIYFPKSIYYEFKMSKKDIVK